MHTMNRRALVAGAAAALPAIAALPTAAAALTHAPDPIFAAIEEWRRAWAAFGVAVSKVGDLLQDAPGFTAADAECEEADDAVTVPGISLRSRPRPRLLARPRSCALSRSSSERRKRLSCPASGKMAPTRTRTSRCLGRSMRTSCLPTRSRRWRAQS
jgi:hypothetical protein